MSDDETFLGRWSRRKSQARAAPQPVAVPGSEHEHLSAPVPLDASIVRVDVSGRAPTSPLASGPLATGGDTQAALADQHVHADQADRDKPLPTLESLRGLESEYSDFLKPEVAEDTRRAALKKLFADPHFNQMDRLDVYIDDYNQFEPMSAAVATSLAVYHRLSVFDHLASEQAKVREANEEAEQGRLAPSADEAAPAEPTTASATTSAQSASLGAAATATDGDSVPAGTINAAAADGDPDRDHPKHSQ